MAIDTTKAALGAGIALIAGAIGYTVYEDSKHGGSRDRRRHRSRRARSHGRRSRRHARRGW